MPANQPRIRPNKFGDKPRSLFLTALLTACWTGCNPPDSPLRVRLSEKVLRPGRSVVLFFPDGMDLERMQALAASGRLPNIERLFLRGGVGVKHAITSIPSMTYPNAASLMTGRFPGRHGIVGNQWFERRSLASPDYITLTEYLRVNQDLRATTLFEAVHDLPTVNIQGSVRRGCGYDVDISTPAGLGWFVGLFERVDQLVGGSFEAVVGQANEAGRWPSLIVLYFPGLDEIGHRFRPDSPRYEDAMWSIDCQIGRVAEAVRAVGMADRTYFTLVSDHGHRSTSKSHVVDVVGWLRDQARLRVHEGSIRGTGEDERTAFVRRYEAIVMNGSYRRVAVHLRGADGWREAPSAASVLGLLVADAKAPPLCSLDGVGLVAMPLGPGRVRVLSRRGCALARRRTEGGRTEYCLSRDPARPERADPADVIEYSSEPALRSFVDAGWHDSQEWLAATASAKYPDFVPQIVVYFDSPRAGDFVVFAERGYVFADHDPGVHGSATSEDMRIPLYFCGPDLPHGGRIDHARIVDVMPTIVEILAGPDRLAKIGPLDGVSLLSELRAARP